MIVGEIDSNLEARVTLSIIQKESSHDVLFLIDSGFNGYLAVPMSVVRQLSLPLATVQRGAAADGRVSYFDTVDVCVIWDDKPKFIRAQVLDEPLIGTRMLSGYDMQVRWEVGGFFDCRPFSQNRFLLAEWMRDQDPCPIQVASLVTSTSPRLFSTTSANTNSLAAGMFR